ncbi:uncharacterized protein LOC131243203 isoform X2 [Magnolia sinica]|uniref:uncharacterized protein LOC131243203 isoform X2 n=1 Tax=Magnolia sinica TaxID=86752 RepID=UPI002658531E|nr:uncharacterized protein LOC131243203 isoform X2 [Magnolia sinica]
MLPTSSVLISGSGEREEEEKCRMLRNSGFGDQKWREKMMEGEARTVDCLRGRLLAERVTSKAAKEDADLMGKKLIELERQLQLEMESRNRVEKKLKLATRKLQSLKLSAVPSQSSSPEKSESSASSSTVSSGLQKQEEEEQKADLQTADSGEWGMDQNAGKTTDVLLNVEGSRLDNNSVSNSEQAGESKEVLSSGESATTADAIRQSSLGGEELGKAQDGEDFEGDLSLALVPASMWHEIKASEPRFNTNAHDVLVALQHAKAKLQSSMDRIAIQSRSYELCGV